MKASLLDLRADVDRLLQIRSAPRHKPTSIYAARQEGECNMLAVVLQLIDARIGHKPLDPFIERVLR